MRTNHNKDVMDTQIFRSETSYFKRPAHKCQRKNTNLWICKENYDAILGAAISNGMQAKKRTAYKRSKIHFPNKTGSLNNMYFIYR